jgi:hypothetical protein
MNRRLLLVLVLGCGHPEPIRPDPSMPATAQRLAPAQRPPLGVGAGLAQPLHWDLSVIYPDNERKMFAVYDQGQRIQMRSAVWACEVEPIDRRERRNEFTVETRGVRCVDGRSIVSSTTACAETDDEPPLRLRTGFLSVGEAGAEHLFELSCR